MPETPRQALELPHRRPGLRPDPSCVATTNASSSSIDGKSWVSALLQGGCLNTHGKKNRDTMSFKVGGPLRSGYSDTDRHQKGKAALKAHRSRVIKTTPLTATAPRAERAHAARCGGACGGRRSRRAPPLGVGAEAGREGDAAEAGEPIDEAEPLREGRAVLRGTLGEGLLRLGHEGSEQRRLVELLVAHLVRSAITSGAMVVEPW